MAVRLTEGEKKYTGGTAIEITANRVVNLLLREENNLIKIDDNEIYCDLQLQDGLTPSDTIPVGVTTGRVVEADGWIKSGTILCFKTTSGDYVKRIYGDDGKLYIDNGTGTFKQIYLKPEIDALLQDLDARKQDLLVSGENIKKLNNESLLGSGNITINGLPEGGTVGQVVTKTADGAEWADKYNAGPGIIIGDCNDYSAMQGPAPSGFHVPSRSEWVALCGVLTTTFSMSENATTVGTYLKMPKSGERDNSSAGVAVQGTYGYYWSSSRNDSNNAYSLYFSSSGISTQSERKRSLGFSVRCFKDIPIVPKSSWTKLYDGSSIATGAGVFWNSDLGLISVSGDGTTRYTIQDKNLGATTVYNDGDTLSESNCGKYYQWGNNYGFPRTGTITNTSTDMVNASTYGPGNYYLSSTFITRSDSPYRWDSTDNGNLRGGVTGVVTIQNAIYIDVDFVRGLIN